MPLARIWLEMVMAMNNYNFVSYNILEMFVSGKGDCTISKWNSSYSDPFQLFYYAEKWGHDHDQKLMTTVKWFIISCHNMRYSQICQQIIQADSAMQVIKCWAGPGNEVR